MILKGSKFIAVILFFISFVMAFVNWLWDENYFSLWLIFLLLMICMFFLFREPKVEQNNKLPLEQRPPPPKLTPEEEEAERKVMKERREKYLKLQEEAGEFIKNLCESKNIKLWFFGSRGSGHCDLPERWKFEKPIPLTPEELYEIKLNSQLNVTTKLHEDRILYAHEFSISSGLWIVYELENRDS